MASSASGDRREPIEGAPTTEIPPTAPQPIEIARLQPGQAVDGLLVCTRRATIDTRDGVTFLLVVLRDGHNEIQGLAFERVHELASAFERGATVHVRGRVTTYRDELQIRLAHINRHELTPPADFLPVSPHCLEELDGYLEHLAREVVHPGYRALLDSLLTDPAVRHAWRTAPCTCSGHHAYLGGLLEHSVAVATLAFETCSLHPRLNRDLLISSAIVHDIGLTRCFTYNAAIGESLDGVMLGHLALGLEMLRAHADRVRLPREDWRPLAHCVMAHHGPRSILAREYACAEALALQRIVALDEGLHRGFAGGPLV